jgi:hypothetical protein
MIGRCHRPNHRKYHAYGAKGISVCDQWRRSFDNFLADMGPKPKGFSIERKENSLGYDKNNCVWANAKTQNRNRRNVILVEVKGVNMCLQEWCELLELSYPMVYCRLRNGMEPMQAFTHPRRRHMRRREAEAALIA